MRRATTSLRGCARRIERPPLAAGRTLSAGPARRHPDGTLPPACRGALRRQSPAAARARPTGRCVGDHSADGLGGRGIADQAERFGGAALHERRRIGERGDQRVARRSRRRSVRARTRPSAALQDRDPSAVRRAARRRRPARRGRPRARRGGEHALRCPRGAAADLPMRWRDRAALVCLRAAESTTSSVRSAERVGTGATANRRRRRGTGARSGAECHKREQ